jgi:hypothetical protein
MNEMPRFMSRCTARSLWHEYRIYDDRIELPSILGTWRVPFDHVEGVEVNEPMIGAVLGGRFDFSHWPGQIKLDLADFCEHVTLDKEGGAIRKLHFTPEDPKGFKEALDAAIVEYRRRHED